jgi:hypothetical protein
MYEEAIRFTDRKQHEGITLEAVQGATLRMRTTDRRLITIEDVPRVRITGFKMCDAGTVEKVLRAFVVVSGRVPGVALTRQTLTPKGILFGFLLQNAVAMMDDPLRIEHCTIRPDGPQSNDGINVVGSLGEQATGRFVFRSNRIFSSQRGINLHGTIRDVHVVGNLLVNCIASGIQLEDFSVNSRGVLVANNTAFSAPGNFRVWDYAPYEELSTGQVEVANNLFFAAEHCDVAYILDPRMGKDQTSGDSKTLLKLWRFHHNRRDFSGVAWGFAIPAGRFDARLNSGDLLSTSASDLDRVRPGKDSPLATQGAGSHDPTLPLYIGALPREGDTEWDWDRTWRARVKNVPEKK